VAALDTTQKPVDNDSEVYSTRFKGGIQIGTKVTFFLKTFVDTWSIVTALIGE
jgi:hypothetical protein